MKRPPASSVKTASKSSASPRGSQSYRLGPARRACLPHARQPSRLRVRLVSRFQVSRLRRRRPARRKQLVGRQTLHASLARQRIPNPPSSSLPSEVSGPLHGLQIAVPRWSPDGKAIAFIGGLMSDQGVTGGDVWIDCREGAPPAANPATHARPPRLLAVDRLGRRRAHLRQRTRAAATPVSCASACRATAPARASPPASIAGFQLSRHESAIGRLELSLSATADRSLFVFQASSFDQPAEIYAAGPAAADARSRLLRPHPALSLQRRRRARLGQLRLARLDQRQLPCPGLAPAAHALRSQQEIPAHCRGPRRSCRRCPLPLEWRWRRLQRHGLFRSRLLRPQPNPRGSYGQGEAFTQANRKDFGYGDLRDILAGVDTVLAKYPVDPNRVGLTGWSYGGFMTMFAVTQTHRFRAAVAGAGISDWL